MDKSLRDRNGMTKTPGRSVQRGKLFPKVGAQHTP